jgi:hypothetical protein
LACNWSLLANENSRILRLMVHILAAFNVAFRIHAERKAEPMQADAHQIQELCTQIIAEKDPEKMALLAKKLEAIIVEREQKLRKSLDRSGIGLGGD